MPSPPFIIQLADAIFAPATSGLKIQVGAAIQQSLVIRRSVGLQTNMLVLLGMLQALKGDPLTLHLVLPWGIDTRHDYCIPVTDAVSSANG